MNLQRLLDEGLFVASYKFALLLALSDLAIEKGDDTGAVLPLSTDEIAEEFIQYYWRHVVPYPAATAASILQQNAGKQAAVVNLLRAARGKHGDSLATIMKETATWKTLRRDVSSIVRIMPLWKLQTVGREHLDFLYETPEPEVTSYSALVSHTAFASFTL